MVLFLLLVVPVLLGVIGLLFGKGRITLKEFLVHEAVVLAIIIAGYFIALHGRTADTEIWNGTIAKKWQGTGSCCHSYPCNCRSVCSGSGKSQSCSTHCDTCYLHSRDTTWNAVTSNGETAYSDGCNSPGSPPPARYLAITVGEPTAIEHGYVNYIKGNPDSIMKRQGAAAKYAGRLPDYPRVYDLYRANRFIGVGTAFRDPAGLNRRLSELNARQGGAKQANITVVVVREPDQSYLEGLREAWIGGKKNDVIVVIGLSSDANAADGAAIAWAGVLSWTKAEDLKIVIRDDLMALGRFDGDAVLGIIDRNVSEKFVRRPMSDFEYLKSTIEPSRTVQWVLFILGCLIAVGLQLWFWHEDPFGR